MGGPKVPHVNTQLSPPKPVLPRSYFFVDCSASGRNIRPPWLLAPATVEVQRPAARRKCFDQWDHRLLRIYTIISLTYRSDEWETRASFWHSAKYETAQSGDADCSQWETGMLIRYSAMEDAMHVVKMRKLIGRVGKGLNICARNNCGALSDHPDYRSSGCAAVLTSAWNMLEPASYHQAR